jgi:hypothetical protein
MADGPDITAKFPQLEQLRAAFRGLPRNIAAKYMGAALNKSIQPGLQLLKTLTPRGPTGNLKRAIRSKVKRYTGSPTSRNPAKSPGAAVAMAGYAAAPRTKKDDLKSYQKGFHAGFLEFGTKRRRTKGNIASSFRRSGKVKTIVAKRSGAVTSKPRPPKGFVRVVPRGETVDLGEFPIGGTAGVPPVKTAFDRSRATMSSAMVLEMTKALNNAIKEMASPFRAGRK